MSEAFPGSLAERKAQGKGSEYAERARKGLGTAGDIAQILNTARWAVPAAISTGAAIVELVRSNDKIPDNSAFSWVDDLDLDIEDPALVAFLGIGSILAAYFLYIGLRPQAKSSQGPVYETPTWRRA